MEAMVLAMGATEATTSARGRLRLSLDTLVLAMVMEAMVLAMLDTEATTLARGRLRLSLAILVLAMAMAAMVLAMLDTEATTLARGRLRLMLACCMPTTPLCMPPAMSSLPMLDTWWASKLSSRLIPNRCHWTNTILYPNPSFKLKK